MRISTILDNVEFGQLALPEFQRGYVWNRDQVRGLMSSLYRRYPVGGLLVWTTEVDPALVRGAAAAGVVKLLLDGQQRITSLYGVIKGEPPAFFQGNLKAFSDLYFNVKSETFEFYGPVKMRDDPFWVSASDIFQHELEDLLVRLSDHVDSSRELIDYQTRLGRIQGIRDIELYQEEITGSDKTIDEVVEIFNRVNSGGTKLNAGDLALARICADWPGARTELRDLLDGWKERGFEFKQEWLLRAATAVATNQAQFGSLRGVSVEEFATALKKAEQAINFLLNLVGDRLGIDHDRVLAGRGAFAALVRLVAENGGYVSDLSQQQRILFWYVHNFLWGRYSSSTETVLQRDLDALEVSGLDGLLQELDRWRGSLVVRPDDFDTWGVGARSYPMLYVLSRVGGARDLGNGLQLSASMLGSESRLHLHHIFPKARLRDAGYSTAEINAIANFSFLTAQSNLTISAADPGQYLAQVHASHPGVLESQWIPTDPSLWRVDRYRDFLAARRELLAGATNVLLDTLGAGEAIAAASTDASGPAVVAAGAPPTTDEDPVISEILELVQGLHMAPPERDFEIIDQQSGELLAVADLAWPDGLQPGRSLPLAFLLEPDEDMETRLGELGYRFFVHKERLVAHLEEIFGIDLDGDGVIGPTAH